MSFKVIVFAAAILGSVGSASAQGDSFGGAVTSFLNGETAQNVPTVEGRPVLARMMSFERSSS